MASSGDHFHLRQRKTKLLHKQKKNLVSGCDDLTVSDARISTKIPGNFFSQWNDRLIFSTRNSAATARSLGALCLRGPLELAGSLTAPYSNVMCLDYLSQTITGSRFAAVRRRAAAVAAAAARK